MTASLTGPTTASPRIRARNLTIATAVAFLAIGIIGFVVTGFDDFFHHHTDEHLLWFEINPAHNLVHLVFGATGLALVRRPRGPEMFGWIVGLGYLGALLYGVVALDETWDVLSVNVADNWLHLVLALVGFAIVATARVERWADRPTRSERPAAGPQQTDADVASSLPPGAGRKADLGPRGDVDRVAPYDEQPMGLRMEDAARPEPEP
jgi:hypothetical protein